jgi:formate-dependent nitrite reductase membrane component NrfD
MEHEVAWHFPVIWYLYLAGLGAGAVVVAAFAFLSNMKQTSEHYHYSRMARYGAVFGPIPLIVGVSLLIFELGQPSRPLNLYKVINLSPMSIGSWFLLFFIITSVIYAITFMLPAFTGHERLRKTIGNLQHALSLLNIPLGLGVAIYTGVLLGAMPSRPLWNSPILAMLFMISALSTGIAAIIITRVVCHRKAAVAFPDRRLRPHGRRMSSKRPGRRYHETGYLLATTDLILICLELIAIFLFIMFAHLTVGNLKYAIAVILPGGAMADAFWIGVILIGLILPAIVELYAVFPRLIYNVPFVAHRSVEFLVALAVLIGGFMLRYVIVIAGQITGPMGI